MNTMAAKHKPDGNAVLVFPNPIPEKTCADSNNIEAFVDIKIKAYRIKGGAIVRVFRNGKERRYKVGLKRFALAGLFIFINRQ